MNDNITEFLRLLREWGLDRSYKLTGPVEAPIIGPKWKITVND